VYNAVAPSHTVTSYKSPVHYTAVTNGAVGPSYIAKNTVLSILSSVKPRPRLTQLLSTILLV
jgi:hypothetical protein